MARPEEFKFTTHCCGAEEITLECKICQWGDPGGEIRIPSDSDASEIFTAIADHVHRDPSVKACARVLHRRKALEV